MQKNIVTIVLAVVCLGLIGYIVFNQASGAQLNSAKAKELAQKFVSENLLPPGITVSYGDITEVNGLYKMAISFPDNTTVETYLTKDGKLFFPEAMNIEEVIALNAGAAPDGSSGELQKVVLIEGTGDRTVQSGDSITVDYVGTLADGTKFDSSVDRGEPFTFTVGESNVIQGWHQGVLGMKVGEEAKLTIPANLAYGEAGSGSIPPNATLIFEIKLISINE